MIKITISEPHETIDGKVVVDVFKNSQPEAGSSWVNDNLEDAIDSVPEIIRRAK